MAERQDQDRAIEPGLAGPIHVRQAFSCTETGSGRHFPGRREPIALRSPCSAQALGDLPWSPARRMRRAPGGCGKNLRRDAILHRCKPGFAIPGEPARRMRRALFFTPREMPSRSGLLRTVMNQSASSREQRLRQRLESRFTPTLLTIEDESHLHAHALAIDASPPA